MKDIDMAIANGLACLAVCVIFGVSHLTQMKKFEAFQQTAITLGYAEYNATNGVWYWKTNR